MTTGIDRTRRIAKSARLAAAGVVALLLAASRATVADEPDVVVVTRIEGELSESMHATLARAISTAEDRHASQLVVEIDSPGGAVTTMESLASLLDMSKVRPTAFVVGQAASAAAYLALVCEHIYTREQVQIGSAMPVYLSPFGGLVPTDLIDASVREKLMSDLRSKFRGRAQHHQRKGMGALAEAMVDPAVEVVLVQSGKEEIAMTRKEFDDLARQQPSARIVKTLDDKDTLLNLTAAEAFDLGFTDGICADRQELLETLGAADARVIEIEASALEKAMGAIGNWAWLLWIVALVLVFIEIKTPGFGVPGIAGASLIALLLLRNWLVGLAELPEILLVLLGAVLLLIELFLIPGFGITGILGIVCVAVGVVLSFVPFVRPEGPLEDELMRETLRNFALSIVGAVVGAYLFTRFVLPKLPFYRRLVLMRDARNVVLGDAAAIALALPSAGDVGVAISPLRPAGKVEIAGSTFDASSGGDFIERGTAVRVVGIESGRVVVEPLRSDA